MLAMKKFYLALSVALFGSLSFGNTVAPRFYRIAERATVEGNYDGPFEVEQLEAQLNTGRCVLLLTKPRIKYPIKRERLQRILGSSGRIVNTEDSNDPAVNCHAFAMKRAGVALPEHTWLDPDRSYLALLKEYFSNTQLRFDETNRSSFDYDSQVQDGDLVLMVNDMNSLNHSGIVVKRNGFNWIISKLDEDMTVMTPLDGLWDAYAVSTAKVFRRK